MARLERRAMLTPFLEKGVGGQVEFAFQFPGMMAAGAAPFEERNNLVVVTHRRRVGSKAACWKQWPHQRGHEKVSNAFSPGP